MNSGSASNRYDEAIQSAHESTFTHGAIVRLKNEFSRNGFIKVRDIIPDEISEQVRTEVYALLDDHAERRDLRLATTGYTPRFMSVVKSEEIAENHLISILYRSRALNALLTQITGESLYPCPSKDEEFLITRQERKGDTHGWHWGDFSYALIWIIETPSLDVGGMLQCVPHTTWDKSDPQIHQYLCDNQISTYSFTSGDIYLLRTDTTLHRTVPLNEDTTRIILNMTWAARRDLGKTLIGDDRWWEDERAAATEAVKDR
jgi:hypothetical protein